MNRALLVRAAIVMGCAAAMSPASAQGQQPGPDPIVGTWKLNPAHTHTSGPVPILPPAQRVEEYRQTETGHIALSITTTASDGTTTTSNMLFSARGGVVTQQSPSEGQMLVETLVVPGEWLVDLPRKRGSAPDHAESRERQRQDHAADVCGYDPAGPVVRGPVGVRSAVEGVTTLQAANT